jgi:hypothetical protein
LNINILLLITSQTSPTIFQKNLIQQSLLEKLTVYAASQKNFSTFMEPEGSLSCSKSSLPVLVVSHMNPIYNPKPYIPKIRCIILQYTKIFRTVSSPRLSKRNFNPFFVSLMRATSLPISFFLYLIILITYGAQYKLWICSVCMSLYTRVVLSVQV